MASEGVRSDLIWTAQIRSNGSGEKERGQPPARAGTAALARLQWRTARVRSNSRSRARGSTRAGRGERGDNSEPHRGDLDRDGATGNGGGFEQRWGATASARAMV